MSASTRILLCRLACIAFCFVPTTIVGGWTCWRATTAFAVAERAEWRHALEQRLGLVATIGAVSYPSPGLCRLEGLVLLDPESRQPLAEAAVVEVLASQSGWHVELWQPQVPASGLGALARVIEERMLRGSEESLANCTLVANQLTIHQAGVAQSLEQLAGRFTFQTAGPELTCEFKLPDANSAAEPIRLTVSRNRQQSPPATRWQLETAGQSLPCQWLAEMLPEISRLGRDCRFAGTLSVTSSVAAWSGVAAGRLGPLDLDTLVSEQFPHQLSGQATLDIEQLALDRGRLAELRGTLRASHGALSPSLLQPPNNTCN